MNSYVFAIAGIVLLLAACSGKPTDQSGPPDSTAIAVAKDSATLQVTAEQQSEDDYEISDCVFDTSTYKFTTDVLRRYKADISFMWDKESEQAIAVLSNADTLLLHIGGCNHFGYSAVLPTAIPFTDSVALLKKSHWLAENFFDEFSKDYAECIVSGKVRSVFSGSTDRRVYEFVVNDTALTNYVYEGFWFERRGKRTEIVMGGYIN